MILIVAGVIGYLFIGWVLAMLTVVWDRYMPEDYHLIIGEETLEGHCVKLALAWPLFTIFYIVMLVGFLLFDIARLTITPFKEFLERKR